MQAQRTVVEGAALCPRCGARLRESRLTRSESTRLGVALTSASEGAVTWRTCSNCGYAALHAQPKAVDARGAALPGPRARAGAAGAVRMGAAHAGHAAGHAFSRPVRAAAAAFGPFEQVPADTAPRRPTLFQSALVFASAALGIAGPALLFLAARAVMGTSRVAVGAIAEIASATAVSAPDWVWFVPLGTMSMMSAFLINLLVAHDLRRPHLVVVFWAALFGLLGAQFLAYGSSPAGGVATQWGWVAIGTVFCLLAVPAVAVIFLPQMWKGFDGAYRVASLAGLASGLALALWVHALLFT